MKNDRSIEFPKHKSHEFYYIPILFALLFILKVFNVKIVNDFFNPCLFIAFGLIHILSSNVFAYMYNLSYIALLIPLRIKPLAIKFFGVIVVLNAFRIIIFSD